MPTARRSPPASTTPKRGYARRCPVHASSTSSLTSTGRSPRLANKSLRSRGEQDATCTLPRCGTRHEAAVLGPKIQGPTLTWVDRAFLSAVARLLPAQLRRLRLVSRRTLLRWHAQLVARRWTYPRQQPGRPPVAQSVRALD